MPLMPTSASDLLLIDAGNSRIKWALSNASGVLQARGVVPLTTSSDASPGAAAQIVPLDGWPDGARPIGAWISNVAGAVGAQRIDHWLDARWPALPRHVISACREQCGVRNRYDTPAQLGSDRWASLIAAHAAYPGEHLLIATCGTATTFESLHADGTFDGGLIAPGLRLMMQALGQHTAQLPLIADHHEIPADAHGESRGLAAHASTDAPARASTPSSNPDAPAHASTPGSNPETPAHASTPGSNHESAEEPPRVSQFARETLTSIGRGCLLAQAALIERAWRDWAAHLHADVRLVLSGGDADAISPLLNAPYTRHDHLVLEGLARIAADTNPGAPQAAGDRSASIERAHPEHLI
jgi:type III pantothenate kinase